MTPNVLLWLSAAGLFTTCLAATGVKVLHDFSHRELEIYCRRRGNGELFARIAARHDQVALGAESLQILSAVVMLLAGGWWLVSTNEPVLQQTSWQSMLAGVFVSTVLLLSVTSWIPWAVVKLWSAPFLYHTWRIWLLVEILVWPLSLGVKIMDALMRRLAARPEGEDDEEEAFEDEIRAMVNTGMREGLLEEDAREMIEGVIELGDATVANIMTPRSRVDALDVSQTWPQAMEFVIEQGRTRFPVYDGSLDNIVGVLYVKDLLRELTFREVPEQSLAELMREPRFIPSTTPLDDLLQDFLKTRNHMAIVIDEYRGVSGVVTIEDVIEEIVGEIMDESDTEEEPEEVRVISSSVAEVLAQTQIDEVNQQLGAGIPESEVYDTIGGFVISQLGYIPQNGEALQHGPFRLTIIDASRRRVSKLRVERIEEQQKETA